MVTVSGLTSSNWIAPYAANGGSAGINQLADLAVQESGNASIIASFGSGGAATPTYTAAGLLNSYLQAGKAVAGDTPQSNLSDFLGSTESGTPVSGSELAIASGEYVGLEGAPTDANAANTGNWATVLKGNPALAYQVVADSQNQNLISAFSAFA